MADADLSLALLVSSHPDTPVEELWSVLLAAGLTSSLALKLALNDRPDGDVERAQSTLSEAVRLRKRQRFSGLGEWLRPLHPPSSPAKLIPPPSASNAPTTSPFKRPQKETADARSSRDSNALAYQFDDLRRQKRAHKMSDHRSINEVLRRDTTEAPAATLPPITLETPDAIEKHLPCSLYLDFFDARFASDLFLDMRTESESWTKNRWYMVDRQVESPHLTAFYADESVARDASAHWYVGRRTAPPKTFTPLTLQAKSIIEAKVSDVLSRRKRDPLEHAAPWRANVAAANLYYGRQSNVGAHADQLTYLGPAPTIASISLGCQRIFRLRGGYPARTYNIPLPHNSLLIMHAGCQERFKHSVPPANALDAFKPITDPQQRSFGDRINMTFRYYRPDFASPPICRCGVPCLLRADLKHNVLSMDAPARYFWQCQAGQQNEGRSCAHWVALDMREKGPCIGEMA